VYGAFDFFLKFFSTVEEPKAPSVAQRSSPELRLLTALELNRPEVIKVAAILSGASRLFS